jgi:protein tyrosine/serine phosphatase
VSAPTPERRVALGGPVNFRDVGGYATTDGGTVRWGKVYRSDSLHHLTPEDGPLLAAIGIRQAIDFRAGDELDRIGIGHLGQLDIRHVHLPTVDKALHTVRPPDWAPPESAGAVYGIMLRTGAAAYAEALRTLATPGELPAVFFCMAGKDRTGVFGAVLLGLLGVGDDDIVADYVLTHEVVDQIHARRDADHHPSDDEDGNVWRDLPADLLGAHAATMVQTLGIIRDQWGGFDGYASSIGVTDDVLARLRAELVDRGTA